MRPLLLFFFSILFFSANAQSVEVIKYKQLEEYFIKKNDTLYVINFWATWCKPCVEELPSFEKINADYKNQKVKVILISMDFKSKLYDRVIPFVKRNKIASKVLLLDEPDYNAWIDKVSPNWSGAIPATIFVDASKGIRQFYEQSFDYAQLKETIDKNNQ
jgi:thiol-disulfide isomerase/thioredoxin